MAERKNFSVFSEVIKSKVEIALHTLFIQSPPDVPLFSSSNSNPLTHK